jgi:hypothetical protein
MFVPTTESDRKSEDDYKQYKESSDRAADLIAERFALSRDHAREVARLAGLGGEEVRP